MIAGLLIMRVLPIMSDKFLGTGHYVFVETNSS